MRKIVLESSTLSTRWVSIGKPKHVVGENITLSRKTI